MASGWTAMFGSNYEAVALYRISLGIMLLIELVSRFQYLHPFYSDEGWVRFWIVSFFDVLPVISTCPLYCNRTLPLKLLLPKTDSLYKAVCIHCYSGSMIYVQCLLSLQVVLAIMLIVGFKAKLASVASWILYLSLTLRNTWLNFILDR